MNKQKNIIFFTLTTLSMLFSVAESSTGFEKGKSWINLCTENETEQKSQLSYSYLGPGGEKIFLLVERKPLAGCKNTKLPVNYNQVKWLRLIEQNLAKRIDRALVLQGTNSNNRINISEIILPTKENSNHINHRLFPIPVNQELLADLAVTIFGTEQRAVLERNNDTTTLTCKTGNQFAGLLMRSSGARLPQGIETQLNLKYSATHKFDFSVLDSIRRVKENPLHIAFLEASPQTTQQLINIPYNKINSSSEISWSLHCPDSNSKFRIESMQLQAASAKKKTSRGIWVWEPQAWIKTPDTLLQRIKAANAHEVYISIPLDVKSGTIPQLKPLSTFIARAKKQNIDVWAVEGDPHVVLHDKRPIFIKRAKIFAAYNTRADKESRLRGIQYDIEPYLLPGYTLDEPAWIKAYIQTVTTLSQASSLPIDIVIPFWWDSQKFQGEFFLNALSPHIERITVMNYRTDNEQLRKFAEPFLLWGLSQKQKIRIALELGPIEDEKRWHFKSSTEGQLLLIPVGHRYLLMLIDSLTVNPHGKQYKLIRESIARGNNISFYGNHEKAFRLLPQLHRQWIPYSSYDGISLHGL